MSEAEHAWIVELENDRSLFEPDRLRQRIDALDRIERHAVLGSPRSGADAALRNRIESLRAGLEAANERLYRSIRQAIRRGAGADALAAWSPAADPHAQSASGTESYDHLDALLGGVLRLDEPAAETAALEPEMVFYQPTPARHIFGLIDRTGLAEGDVLIDLGSGLGHVPLLAAIRTGARCVGIEREAAFVDCARRGADALGLRNAEFVAQDARAADLSAGTVFYLYTPFTGALLGEVLDRLRREATSRPIRVCTLGPCTAAVAREPWLEGIGAEATNGLAFFRSV